MNKSTVVLSKYFEARDWGVCSSYVVGDWELRTEIEKVLQDSGFGLRGLDYRLYYGLGAISINPIDYKKFQ